MWSVLLLLALLLCLQLAAHTRPPERASRFGTMALVQKQCNITSHESLELVQCLLRVVRGAPGPRRNQRPLACPSLLLCVPALASLTAGPRPAPRARAVRLPHLLPA